MIVLHRRAALISVASLLWPTTAVGDETAPFVGSGPGLTCIAVSGDRAITGGFDGQVRLWRDQSVIAAEHLHDGEVSGVAADGAVLFSCGSDRRLLKLEARRLRHRAERTFDAPLSAVATAAGRVFVASRDGAIHVIDSNSMDVVASWPSRTACVSLAVSADGSRVATGSPVRLFSASGELIATQERSSELHAIAFATDAVASTHWSGELRFWRGNGALTSLSHRTDTRVSGPRNAMPASLALPMTGLAVAGDRVVTAATDRYVRLWSISQSRQLGTLGRHEGTPVALAFSSDGESVLGADLGGGVRWWPLAGLQES